MAGNVDVDHNGHLIRYSENEDVWRCYDIDYANVKLSSVKRKCDEVDRKARDNRGSIPAFLIDYGKVYPCKIVRLGDRGRAYDYTSKLHVDRLGAWIVYKNEHGKNTRKLVDVYGLAPDTGAVADALAKHRAAAAAYSEAAQRVETARAAIPRFTADALLATFGGQVAAKEDKE